MDTNTIFYLMDEVGNAIRHSASPNCELHPFLFSKTNSLADSIAYTVLLLKKDIEAEEKVTRDFLQSVPNFRDARLRLQPDDFFLKAYHSF